MTWTMAEALLKEHGAVFLMGASIVVTIVTLARWMGKRASQFVNDTVLPSVKDSLKDTSHALNQLTGSVEHLSVRTQENTRAIEAMSQDQQRVNLAHATAIAHLQGKVGE